MIVILFLTITIGELTFYKCYFLTFYFFVFFYLEVRIEKKSSIQHSLLAIRLLQDHNKVSVNYYKMCIIIYLH